ncbi:hypothetical protein RRG08_016687 [Elysia crispata]|uniref:Uncharacterized protein n=1 Tax=Elysia crispata TaxID=231223 RepID=A0AAE1E0S9_9GAST|nr:hypothetical protein RRG08_016687 [Elysia crispata]
MSRVRIRSFHQRMKHRNVNRLFQSPKTRGCEEVLLRKVKFSNDPLTLCGILQQSVYCIFKYFPFLTHLRKCLDETSVTIICAKEFLDRGLTILFLVWRLQEVIGEYGLKSFKTLWRPSALVPSIESLLVDAPGGVTRVLEDSCRGAIPGSLEDSDQTDGSKKRG